MTAHSRVNVRTDTRQEGAVTEPVRMSMSVLMMPVMTAMIMHSVQTLRAAMNVNVWRGLRAMASSVSVCIT